jgi:serine protease Do
MEDIILLDAIERYIKGEMQPEEVLHFDALRKTNAEVDQMVVQHTFFLKQMEQIADRKHLRTTLDTVHANLVSQNEISIEEKSAKVISIWDKYRRKLYVAASIAALVSFCLLGIQFAYKQGKSSAIYSPKNGTITTPDSFENRLKKIQTEVADIKKNTKSGLTSYTNGTSFIVNENGYLLTNQHVIKGAKQVYVYNEKYGDLAASVILEDADNDLAILKIVDTSFKALDKVPYTFKNVDVSLAQKVYTMGYCRPPYITYNEGFVSSKAANATYNNTNNFLLTLQVDGGNSGSPILNENGDIIGIVSAKEKLENGYTLGLKTMAVKKIIDALQTQTKGKMKTNQTGLAGLSRNAQTKKLENYIFMVKSK